MESIFLTGGIAKRSMLHGCQRWFIIFQPGFSYFQPVTQRMSRPSAADCSRRSIHAASEQAGSEIWPSRTSSQNGKRLAAYGLYATIELRQFAGR